MQLLHVQGRMPLFASSVSTYFTFGRILVAVLRLATERKYGGELQFDGLIPRWRLDPNAIVLLEGRLTQRPSKAGLVDTKELINLSTWVVMVTHPTIPVYSSCIEPAG